MWGLCGEANRTQVMTSAMKNNMAHRQYAHAAVLASTAVFLEQLVMGFEDSTVTE
jgi:hypothetical protein